MKKDVFTYYHHQDLEAFMSIHWTSSELDLRNEAGWTLCMVAAKEGRSDWVKALKDKGANIDLLNPQGQKAVIIAANHGHSYVMIHLIDSGCGG